jgi:AraC family transcriptional regulator
MMRCTLLLDVSMSYKNHLERMQSVVQYIENNLNTELDVKQLSSIACYSEFHFHRLFRAYIGESVYGFRKRLLLEKAVKLLCYSTESITDISYRCGYENQTSFNKAFKSQFLYTPSQVRKQQVSLSKITTDPILDTNMTLTPNIKTIDDIHVISARAVGPYAEAAPIAWGRIMKFSYSNKLMEKNIRSIGISHDDPKITEPNCIRYDACLDISANIENEEGLEAKIIPGGKYAIFLHKGPYEKLIQTYSYIYNQWLVNSKYSLSDDKTCFEIYLNRDPRRTKPENLKTQIYIPVIIQSA